MTTSRTEARVDLDAIAANVAELRARAGGAEVMAVVKADAYGHGMVPAARAALAGGATWLGTAYVEEALALRAAGIRCRILSLVATPAEGWAGAVAGDVDVSAGSPWAVAAIAAAAEAAGRPARVHLEADTGLSRGGATALDWPVLVEAALRAEAGGRIRVVGLWSHLACADEPGHPATARQVAAFTDLLAHAEKAGVVPEVRHLANSAAALVLPDTRFDLVRPGIAVYGLSPAPRVATARELGLRPAMTLRARLALTKRVGAGEGVSYGHTHRTERPTTLGLVPLGYADGVPRAASGVGPLLAAGSRRTVAGRVCMDQFVVDLGDDAAAAGDDVVLFGPGDGGEPTAQDWADALGTISYEVVTGVGARVPRHHVGGGPWT